MGRFFCVFLGDGLVSILWCLPDISQQGWNSYLPIPLSEPVTRRHRHCPWVPLQPLFETWNHFYRVGNPIDLLSFQFFFDHFQVQFSLSFFFKFPSHFFFGGVCWTVQKQKQRFGLSKTNSLRMSRKPRLKTPPVPANKYSSQTKKKIQIFFWRKNRTLKLRCTQGPWMIARTKRHLRHLLTVRRLRTTNFDMRCFQDWFLGSFKEKKRPFFWCPKNGRQKGSVFQGTWPHRGDEGVGLPGVGFVGNGKSKPERLFQIYKFISFFFQKWDMLD